MHGERKPLMPEVPVSKILSFTLQGKTKDKAGFKIQKGENSPIMTHCNQAEETSCTNFFEASPEMVFGKDKILGRT